MQESHELIAMLHASHPGIPRAVGQTVTQTNQAENYGDCWVWWVYTSHNVCYDFARRAYNSNSYLSETHMDLVDEDR